MRGLTGIVTCHQLIGTNTHFYHGRTLPCDMEACPACAEGLSYRWHAWVSLQSKTSETQILFEMTARAAEPLKTYFAAYGTLRGCEISAKRANTSPNSRVLIQTRQADLSKITLKPEPDLLAALAMIWNVSTDDMQVNGLLKNVPHLQATIDETRTAPETFPKHKRNGRTLPHVMLPDG
jgi:hypothetical protein